MAYNPQYVRELSEAGKYDEAVAYCREWAAAGSAEAAHDLAVLYYGNDEMNNDFFKLAQTAYASHVPGSAVTYGLAFADGRGIIKSSVMAERLFREAAESGEALGCFYYARSLADKKDYDGAAQWFYKSYTLGTAVAMHILCDMYSPEKGPVWREKAALCGCIPAKYDLAVMYETGNGIPADMDAARRLYSECADYSDAAECLQRLTDGRQAAVTESEPAKTEAQSNPMVEKAQQLKALAEAGDAKAQFQYGQCFEDGKGVQTDAAAAVSWYLRSAQNGYVKAQHRMGQLYEDGLYVPQDINEAITWYTRATQNEMPYSVSFFRLYQIYSDGVAAERDDEKARNCLISSANGGYTVAALLLAGFYERGEGGFPVSIPDSARFYLKAAECNNVEAKKHIADVLAQADAGDPAAMYFAWAYIVCKERGKSTDAALAYLASSAKKGFSPAVQAMRMQTGDVPPEQENESDTPDAPAQLTDEEKQRINALYATAAGNPDALYELGCIYKDAALREQNNADLLRMSAQFFAAAASRDHAAAQYEYANCLSAGRGTPVNPQEAFRYYNLAYKNGDVRGLTSMGIYYMRGKATDVDKAKAEECFEQAAQAGDTEAQYRLGKLYATQGRDELMQKAFEISMEAAKAGHAKAQFFVGSCYESGKGTEPDMQKALEWYRAAAAQGHTGGDYAIAFCYEKGKGVEKDEHHAFELYLSAAERDNPSAQFRIGCMYEHGTGTEVNPQEAFRWYSISAEKGNYKSLHAMGNCYEYGIGVEKDMARAVSYYKTASEHGNSWSQYRMCLYYSSGIHAQPNYDEALRYCRMAAENKSAFAQYCLGRWYEKGFIVEQDMRKASTYYRMAAEQGHAAAQCALGICYEDGNGVQKNITEAIMMYGKSAHQNYAPALYRLGLCCETGYGIALDVSEALLYYEKSAALGYAPAKERITALMC